MNHSKPGQPAPHGSNQEVRLDDLYQEVILDHNRHPRNFRKLEDANRYSHGHNPLCGDDYHLYLHVDRSGIISKVGFEGSGCAISKSSASMMTSLIEGKSTAEAEALRADFLKLVTTDAGAEVREKVGRMKIFEGVKKFPVRVKCATLIWQTLGDALKDVNPGTQGA